MGRPRERGGRLWCPPLEIPAPPPLGVGVGVAVVAGVVGVAGIGGVVAGGDCVVGGGHFDPPFFLYPPAPKAPEGVVLGVPRSAWPKNNNTP